MTGWPPRPPGGWTTTWATPPAPRIQRAILATYPGWSRWWSRLGLGSGPGSNPVSDWAGPGGLGTSLHNAYERDRGVEMGNNPDHLDHEGRA